MSNRPLLRGPRALARELLKDASFVVSWTNVTHNNTMLVLASIAVLTLAVGAHTRSRSSTKPSGRETAGMVVALGWRRLRSRLRGGRGPEAVPPKDETTAQLTQQLSDARAALAAAQARVAQADKLASLGVLLAGVAHEINNPVSFIVNAIEPMRENLTALRNVAAAHPELELDGVLADLGEAVDLLASGADRTAGIVRDLRTFTHAGDPVPTPTDVHASLDVTLRLLHARLGEHVAVVRDYGRIPLVESVGGQLNQVFMNVLANATDAIDTRGSIRIATRAESDRVVIVIQDDGCGIAPADMPRAFDPLFTTKQPGKGTGLGLAITRQIVRDHGGSIDLASDVGRGTSVTITLPLRQSANHP